ncbi:MAG: NYN domain-containing protein [Patescibacteria group bacterium]
MKKRENNFAFIDAQNLYLAIAENGWKLDYKKFRIYLREKCGITKAYMFMGFVPTNQALYNFLQSVGYVLIFKPIIPNEDGRVKGNCDAEFVLQAMIDFSTYHQAVLVTGDGDFYCLVKHLDLQNKLQRVLAPSTTNCSSLLKKVAGKKIAFVSDLRAKLEYIKKEPHEDGTS